MQKNWKPAAIITLGDQIGKQVLLITSDGAYEGGLLHITKDSINIEVDQGNVLAIPRSVLDNDLTELYTLI